MIDFRIRSRSEALALLGYSTLAVYCWAVVVRQFVWCLENDVFRYAFKGIW